jgi:hypothetical protein
MMVRRKYDASMRVICILFLAAFLAIAWRIAGVPVVSARPLSLVHDIRPVVCTVVLEGVRNGQIAGYVRGDVRFFIGDDLAVPNSSGAFLVSAGVLKTDVRTLNIPGGARFVASKKGKRFYPIGSSQGQSLTPANRIYFSSEDEAKAAGFR